MPSHRDYESLNTELDQLFNSLIEMPEEDQEKAEDQDTNNDKKEKDSHAENETD
ncbi:hypothetical protein [Pisciglobus halotolerans]|uniref:Uncharacterized protein n=1 Tax=Pisciglobus halotolerans TaxID=745365 RepID=A0A1I3DU58_9LACT|nr:hypothetical protein [Pisciglobus halotolerans]SFH90089.1 hypothetical protein SAMN04489868_15211 [Pisciglobus halotolerans]